MVVYRADVDGLSPDDPREVGGYRVLRRLGSGGMGVVYLAADPTGRRVAIKVIHPQWARDAGFRRRFTREVAAARRVARFCTAPVLDASLEGELTYLVTEYVDGPDLATVVRERGPLTGGNLEALAAGVAVALHAIHGAGVVHRDLKPSNVVLSPTGPRVIDFGVAQLTEPESLPSQTMLGTPAFMAPEQVRGEPVTPASDVFAWGGLVTYAGTGRLPFGGGPAAEVLYRVAHEGPNLDGLDARVHPLVERAMAKQPDARPTTQELLGALMGRPAAEPAEATQLVERTWTTGIPAGRGLAPPGRPATRRRRRGRWVAALAGLAAVVTLGAAGAWAALTDRDPADLPYVADFSEGWQQGATPNGGATSEGGGYQLTADPTYLLWRSAPLAGLTNVDIDATAALTGGAGEVGLWCGGDTARYRFAVDSEGRGAIFKDVEGSAPVLLSEPVAPGTEGFGAGTADAGIRIQARCRDHDGGADLILWIDGAQASHGFDSGGSVHGGVGVYLLADESGAATARFDSFRVSAVEDG